MSEEEIKKNIDEIIDNYNTFLDDEEFGDYYEREWAEFELKTITAFLDLYNKEKEKNSKAIGHIEACKTSLGNYILSPNETEYLLSILKEE